MSISVTDTLQTACTKCGKKTNDGFYREGLKYCRKCFWDIVRLQTHDSCVGFRTQIDR